MEELAVVFATLAIKHGVPYAVRAIDRLKEADNPTKDEWAALRKRVATPFDEFVKDRV